MTSVVNWSWLFNVLIFYYHFNEEAPIHKQFGIRGTILLAILERRPQLTGYLREEAPFYCVNLGRGWWSFFIFVQKYAGGWPEFPFVVHTLPGGLLIQRSYFIGVAFETTYMWLSVSETNDLPSALPVHVFSAPRLSVVHWYDQRYYLLQTKVFLPLP